MASKKHALLMILMLCGASFGWAQLGGVHNYMDSSYVSSRNMAQHNEWKNNSRNQNFPARPRDMWQLGILGGLFMVNGDVPALPGWNAGLSIRKSLGYVISLRGSITYGEAKGLDYRKNSFLENNPALSVYGSTSGFYVANFKTTAITPSLDAIFSLNNIMFHKKQSKLNLYALFGYSMFTYKTQLDVLNGTTPYNFASLNVAFFSRKRKDIRSDLKNFFDGTYETDAVVHDRRPNFTQAGNGKYNFRHSIDFGVGLEYRLSKRTSLGLEAKYVKTDDDYIDGYFVGGSGAGSSPTPDKDNLLFTNLSLNFNLGNSKKRTAPLWWLNPLDYSYGQLNNGDHIKLPKVPLPDADGDGVTDQFDMEPNTPAGCAVDTHGKSLDTDGDGVPDCRDKELITPTACQPVNADGVGKCPDPQCCKDLEEKFKNGGGGTGNGCGIGDLPSVSFSGSSAKLSKDAEAILAAAAEKIKANPDCKIAVVGHVSPGSASKSAQQLSWDRVKTVINYLEEKQNISSDRFIFKYGEEGDANVVDLRDGTGDEGPNTVPAPHPNLQKSK